MPVQSVDSSAKTTLAENQEKLKSLQARQEALTKARDKIIRDLGVIERRQEEAIDKLSSLGIDATNLSHEDMERMAAEFEAELSEKIGEMEAAVSKAEKLVEEQG